MELKSEERSDISLRIQSMRAHSHANIELKGYLQWLFILNKVFKLNSFLVHWITFTLMQTLDFYIVQHPYTQQFQNQSHTHCYNHLFTITLNTQHNFKN